MSNLIYAIGMILIGISCYFIGLRRGIKITTEKHSLDYVNGYSDAVDWFEKTMCQTKKEKLDKLISELDDLFYDENNEETTNDHA